MGSEVKDITDDLPFEIPDSWVWCRLKQAGELKSGYAFKSNEYVETGVQVVRISDLDNDTILTKNAVYYPPSVDLDANLIQKNSVLICLTGSIGKMAWVTDNEPRYLNQRVGMFIHNKLCNTSYLWTFLQTNYVLYQWIAAKTSTNGNIKNSDVTNLLFPVPPLGEQARIVSEIEKFEPFVAEYDKLEQQATKLDEEIYDKLKKSILQYAIQGKLVPQDPNDEPASVLLERIRAEKKAKLGKKYVDSYIYKGDDNCYYEKVGETVTNISDEMPFDLPENWAWIRLGYIIDFSKSDTVVASQIDSSSWVLDLEDIEKDSGRLLQKKAMSETQSKSDKHSFCKGNVLYSKLRPYLNKVIVADDNGYCTTEILAFDFGQYIVAQYAQIYLMSPYFVDYAMAGAYGVKMPRIGSVRGNAALMPLPPYNEQMRIIQQYTAIKMSIKDED